VIRATWNGSRSRSTYGRVLDILRDTRLSEIRSLTQPEWQRGCTLDKVPWCTEIERRPPRRPPSGQELHGCVREGSGKAATARRTVAPTLERCAQASTGTPTAGDAHDEQGAREKAR